MITQRDRDIWRAAITLANNYCVRESDGINADDGPLEAVRAAADCADLIAAWVNPSDSALEEMFREAGVHTEKDFMCDALNSGDGTYRP